MFELDQIEDDELPSKIGLNDGRSYGISLPSGTSIIIDGHGNISINAIGRTVTINGTVHTIQRGNSSEIS